jgi:ribosomal protein S18 acetylase RimI-like enzyme
MTQNLDFGIRDFSFPEDYESVYELWEAAGEGIHLRKSDQPAEIQKKLKKDPDLFLVAIQNQTLIGSVLAGFDGRRGLVYHLAVKKSYRQQGVGTALMQEIERRLSEKGCIRYYLLVVDDNLLAQVYYSNYGCELLPVKVFAKNLEQNP